MRLLVAVLLLPLVVATHQPFRTFSRVPSRYSLLRHQSSFASFPRVRTMLSFAMRQNGNTGDLCNSERDCKSDRLCLSPNANEETPISCEAGDDLCFCLPDEFSLCKSTVDCEEGEVCAFFVPDAEFPDGEQLCLSQFGLAYLPYIVPIVQPGQPGTALTFESCTSDEQCLAPRVCSPVADFKVCSFEDLSEMACFTDEECDTEGEVCALIPSTGLLCVSEVVAIGDGLRDPSPLPTPAQSPTPSKSASAPTTTPSPRPGSTSAPIPSPSLPAASPAPSKTPDQTAPTTSTEPQPTPDTGTPTKTPELPQTSPTTTSGSPQPSLTATTESSQPSSTSPSPTQTQADADTPICIDARALTHLPAAQLVFDKHSLAPVLCDVNDSCATPGHIVRFQGTAMRMSSYCRMMPCVRKVMHVNSPRYRRGLVIRSNTDGLDFTPFAARYNTRMEEIVLAAAVHVGL